ncbi:hypothetical protein SIO70_26495 [Chitinophaga sancti]|uniref:hypothetical protein n=1 Tax=Chitinophaga sancti TaxID=1004 RepID=UPI002A75C610|nr:hypothetical protein [Chitinophaga sancti]WPQ61916.1 hypothetical protein SIO70_26495 [Chitinophaga sancti]
MPTNKQYKTLDEVQTEYLQTAIKKKGRISKKIKQSFIHATGQLLKEQKMDLQTEIRHLNFAEQYRVLVPKIGARNGIHITVKDFKIQVSGEVTQHRRRLMALGFIGVILGDTFGYISVETDTDLQHILQVQTLRTVYQLV